jgi:hypothetical protein
VHPEFHKILKIRSAEEDLSIFDFTKQWAQAERERAQQNTVQMNTTVNTVQPRRKWKFEL